MQQKRLATVVMGVALYAVVSGCDTGGKIEASHQWGDDLDALIVATVSEIDAKRTWTAAKFLPSFLDGSKSYLALRSNACSYYARVGPLLVSRPLSDREELVLAYAMYGLPLHEYVDFVRSISELVPQGKVSASFVYLTAFPALDDRPDLYLAFRNERIVEVYTAIEINMRRAGWDSALVERATNLLIGKQAQVVIEYSKGIEQPLVEPDFNLRCRMSSAS